MEDLVRQCGTLLMEDLVMRQGRRHRAGSAAAATAVAAAEAAGRPSSRRVAPRLARASHRGSLARRTAARSRVAARCCFLSVSLSAHVSDSIQYLLDRDELLAVRVALVLVRVARMAQAELRARYALVPGLPVAELGSGSSTEMPGAALP